MPFYIKCSLDNSEYKPRIGYLTPTGKKVRSELNVNSIQKMARMVFLLEILLINLEVGSVNSKREIYYRAKGIIKGEKEYAALDFNDQGDSDSVIDYICDLLEIWCLEIVI